MVDDGEAELALGHLDGVAHVLDTAPARTVISVSFRAPDRAAAVVVRWRGPMSAVGLDHAAALLQDAARSLQLALEREAAELSHREAVALRRSQDLQRQFLSRLSHELRTPLTAIRGYASTLLQSDVVWDRDSEQRFLGRIAGESARVGRLVGDLLDFSAIESAILRLQPDWCDLALILDAAAACVEVGGEPAVSVSCDEGLPVVWADHDRLEQVFVNLMDNARRHNPPGTRIEARAWPSGTAEVRVRVSDDGPGMHRTIASDPFATDRRRRSESAGAGLGLSIAKGIVDAHGGSICLEDAPSGTSFLITLPVEAPGRPVEAPGRPVEAPGRLVEGRRT